MQARDWDGLFPSQGDGAPTTVVVAVSGGADSIALLHLLTRVRVAWSLHLVVAHLDHNLRAESADDAHFVAQLAAGWGLPFEGACLPPDALTGNLEAGARRARYHFLAQVASIYQTHAPGQPVEVALAHTANDQAETVLMNLIRGSGLDGLAAMPRIRPLVLDGQPVPGVRVVRPLLAVSRPEILQYLKAHHIPWREDPTNQDPTFVRNRIRHEILPRMQEINPQIVAALCRTASILAAEAARAEADNRQALGLALRSIQEGPQRRVFDLALFRSLDVAAQRAILRAAAICLGQPSRALNFAAVERMRQLLLADDHAGGPYSWVGDLMLTRAHDSFSLHHKAAEPYIPQHPHLGRDWCSLYGAQVLSVPGEITVGDWSLRSEILDASALPHNWPAQLAPWEAYLDADKVGQLVLRGPRPGQRFQPFGLAGHGKALADYFTDRKVMGCLRPGWPLVVDGTQVVWVGGHQIADRVRVSEDSRAVLHLYWEARDP